MKLVILHSEKTPAAPKLARAYRQEFDTRYAQRLLANLRGGAAACGACGPECTGCRKSYGRDFSGNIAAVIAFPSVLPWLIETPARFAPASMPAHEVMLIIHIHEQILLEILERCRAWGTKGVVVPLEASHWMSTGARARARKLCENAGIEIAFPKPLCNFNPPPGGVLARFRRFFHIGFPEVRLDVKHGVITKADVIVSAGCGATYYVARWLAGRGLEDNLELEVISKRMHSFPCTAGMKRDAELGDDTPMHIATLAHRTILNSARKPVETRPELVLSPLGVMLPKSTPVADNIKDIDTAKKLILDELGNGNPVDFNRLKNKAKHLSPAAIISAIILLKQEQTPSTCPTRGRRPVGIAQGRLAATDCRPPPQPSR